MRRSVWGVSLVLWILGVAPRAVAEAPAPPVAPEPSRTDDLAPPPHEEDELFGGESPPAPPMTEGEEATPGAASTDPSRDAGDEDAIFADSPPPATIPSSGAVRDPFAAIRDDPLALGGQLYLRSTLAIADRGRLGQQRLSLPNLLDLYLDARPEERVRAFVSGRLSYDPTVAPAATDALGRPQTRSRVLLDQLWLKTDVARRVFLTIGQERVKWGTTRLWNPNDFVNPTRRDPTALMDERVGVPLIKLQIPVASWNFQALALVDSASTFDRPGVAFRIEKAFSASEFSLSGVAGKGRKTAFGFDFSAALGPVDLAGELSLTDERDTLIYRGTLDFATLEVPTATRHGRWAPRASLSLQYAFKPNDDDVMYLALEGFWNSLGTGNSKIYPWLIAQSAFTPFYLGEAYLGLSWLVPQPGRWDDTSFTLAALTNLSDGTALARLDVSQTLHTRLKLEAWVQGQFGKRGGEFRFALDLPELPPIPEVLPDGMKAMSIPATAVMLGLNLRLAL